MIESSGEIETLLFGSNLTQPGVLLSNLFNFIENSLLTWQMHLFFAGLQEYLLFVEICVFYLSPSREKILNLSLCVRMEEHDNALFNFSSA